MPEASHGSLERLVDVDRGSVSREIFVNEKIYRQEQERIVSALGTRPSAGGERGQRPVEQAQGALAMITAGGAKLVEDARLMETTGPLVAPVDAGERLAFGRQTHVRCLGNHELESTNRRTPRPPTRPGNIYPESTRMPSPAKILLCVAMCLRLACG